MWQGFKWMLTEAEKDTFRRHAVSRSMILRHTFSRRAFFWRTILQRVFSEAYLSWYAHSHNIMGVATREVEAAA